MSREEIIRQIIKCFALLRYQLEYKQDLGDYSLNIYSENLFRDMLNIIFEYELENANFDDKNAPYIDLIDSKNKIAIQITSTKTKDKIDNTLKILNNKPNYKVKILFLIEKPNIKNSSFNEWTKKYNIDISKCLIDTKDLVTYINNLNQDKIEKIYCFCDTQILKTYTTEIVLNLVINHILRNYRRVNVNYADDFKDLKNVDEKIKINNLNNKISNEIKRAMDYRASMEKLNDDNSLSDLREFIIDNLYKNILIKHISNKKIDKEKTTEEIHYEFYEIINFNKVLDLLYKEISSYFDVKDFNECNITWIVISYFFEICDIGAKNGNAD